MACRQITIALIVIGLGGSLPGQTPSLHDRLTEAANEAAYLGFDKAAGLYESIQQDAPPDSKEWTAATFGLAVSLAQMSPAEAGRLSRAAALFEQVAEKAPDSKYAAPAMIARGRIDELVDYLGDKPDLAKARQSYERARVLAGDSKTAHEATLRIAATYIQTYDPEQVGTGIRVLEEWLGRYPDNPIASAMWQYIGDGYFIPLNQYAESLAAYIKADEIGLIEEGREGPLYWRMARIAEKAGNRDAAIAYYTKIIVKTPTSGKAYESQLALKRIGAPVPEIHLFGRAATTQAVNP